MSLSETKSKKLPSSVLLLLYVAVQFSGSECKEGSCNWRIDCVHYEIIF